MKNEQAINETMNSIDNMVHKSLVLLYKQVDRPNENGYFSGQLEAYYHFAYDMVEEYTIQDAIDNLMDDDNGARFEIWQFVSYATDIMQVVHDLDYDTWVVSCNGNPFSYSPSTSRQVSRWIRENRFFPFTPSDVRVAHDECLPITPDIATFSFDNVCIDFHSPYTFHNVWR